MPSLRQVLSALPTKQKCLPKATGVQASPLPGLKRGKNWEGGGGTSGPDKDDDDGKKCLPACLPAALHLNSINNEASELFRHNLDNLLPHIHLELSFRLHKTRWRLGRQY